MSPESFCYWLQGFFELGAAKEITPAQVEMIKEHLALVFNKVTSSGTITVPATPPAPAPTVSEEEMKKIIEDLLKKPSPTLPPFSPISPYPWSPQTTGPLYPGHDPDWWRPQIYCTATNELPPSGLKVECIGRGTSDADLDCTTTSNAPAGMTAIVNGIARNPNEPVFIC